MHMQYKNSWDITLKMDRALESDWIYLLLGKQSLQTKEKWTKYYLHVPYGVIVSFVTDKICIQLGAP